MTLEQHFAAAREFWLVTEAVRRLERLLGDDTGSLPVARISIGRVVDRLRRRFANDFPDQFDPYQDIEC